MPPSFKCGVKTVLGASGGLEMRALFGLEHLGCHEISYSECNLCELTGPTLSKPTVAGRVHCGNT